MPNYFFLLQCLAIGILAGCSVGPVFIMTFNSAACYGLLAGFAVALGAALADGLLFYLGQLGLLSLADQSKSLLFVIDILGGFVLLGLGLRTIARGYTKQDVALPPAEPFFYNLLHAFIPTLLNPLSFLFFTAAGFQILGTNQVQLPPLALVLGSGCVTLGSLAMLTGIACVAARIGSVAKLGHLRFMTLLTGIFFFIAGVYLLTKGLQVMLV